MALGAMRSLALCVSVGLGLAAGFAVAASRDELARALRASITNPEEARTIGPFLGALPLIAALSACFATYGLLSLLLVLCKCLFRHRSAGPRGVLTATGEVIFIDAEAPTSGVEACSSIATGVPVAGGETAYVAFGEPLEVAEDRDWAHGIFSCFNDLPVLAVVCCVPVVSVGQLFQRVLGIPRGCRLVVLGVGGVMLLSALASWTWCPPVVVCAPVHTSVGDAVRCERTEGRGAPHQVDGGHFH
jgi:hypothetical protein